MKANQLVILSGLLLAITTNCPVFGQVNNPLINNSGELIEKSLKFQADEKYTEAITELSVIPENDTNYYYAMTELANSYYGNKQYDSSRAIAARALKEPTGYESLFYGILANSLDALERSDEAITVYKEAIQKFPADHLLQYNLGITYRAQKKYQEALSCFQKAAEINPYYSSCHLMIGLTYLEADQMVPAIMGFTTFLLMNPTSPKAGSVIDILQAVAQIEYKHDSITFVLKTPAGEDDFSDIESILRSKIALSSQYKSKSKLQFDLVKQIQVMCEKLDDSPGAKGFCNKNYVPFYHDLFKNDYIETLGYYILASTKQESVQSWLKKNDRKVQEFVDFTRLRMRELSVSNPITINGTTYNTMHWIKDGRLTALGNTNKQGTLNTGKWVFFYDNGMIEKEGAFDNSGKETGDWKFYFKTGELSEIHALKDGERDGVLKTFYRNGKPQSESNYSNGQITASVKIYHATGQVRNQYIVKDGMRNGPFTVFNQDGGKTEEGTYKAGKYDGGYKSYYADGGTYVTCNYVNGNLTGDYKSNYRSGKKYFEGKYVNGQPTGSARTFWENGAVKEERTFNTDGKQNGTSREYDKEGTVRREMVFNNGNEESEKSYDYDGKLWMRINSKGDKVSEVIFYDKKGGVIVNNPRTRGLSPLKGYYPGGQLFYNGQFKNDHRAGSWTTFFEDGTKKEIENYNDDGEYDGIYKSFYPNGQLEEESSYKKDKHEGYYKAYYANGKMRTEGWFQNDNKGGTWLYYNPLGILTSKEYYIDGDVTGKQHYYEENGKIYKSQVWEYDMLSKVFDYDTTGKVINTYSLDAGNGSFSSVYFNGKKRFDLQQKNGWTDGPAKFYHVNGTLSTEGKFKYDDRQGEWKWYDNASNLAKQMSYVNGKGEGKVTTYIKGKLYSVEYEIHDGSDSVYTWYFPSGKVEQTSTFRDDKRVGPTTLYNEEGQVYIVLNYENDNLISYTYYGADGKLLPPIVIKNETGAVTSTYADKKRCYEGVYKNGWRDGKFIRYFPSGAVREERFYKNNLPEGVIKKYNAAGKLISEEPYFNGDRHGTCKYYGDDGKILREENYYLGQPHGKWKYYDKAGKVTKKEQYYLGEQLN